MEAIRHGLELTIYLALFFIIGITMLTVGSVVGWFGVLEGSIVFSALGIIFNIIGLIVILAAFVGMLYAIIADGVEKGVRAAR